MKLSEKSLQEIIDERLWWEDFDETPTDNELLISAVLEDPATRDKIAFLNQQESGELLESNSLHKLDFYEVDFTELARLALGEGEYLANGQPRGREVDYLKDYSGLKLLIEDLGDTFALYLKDYEFGYIRPLGLCSDKTLGSGEARHPSDVSREDFIKKYVLPAIELDMWEDDFDLKQEMFDYYHDLPDYCKLPMEDHLDIEGLLTTKEAAKKLGISGARVNKMVADKLLDGYKLGNKLLITESSVDQRLNYISEHGKPTRNKESRSWANDYRLTMCKDEEGDSDLSESDHCEFLYTPSDMIEFKKRIMRSKQGLIRIHLKGGHVEEKVWDASSIGPWSGIKNNIRSRADMRKDVREKHGYTLVEVIAL